MDQMQAFYDAVTPRAEAAMAYCDTFALDDMPEDAVNLLHLLYSMVMVSFPVECWGQGRGARHRCRLPRPPRRARTLNRTCVTGAGARYAACDWLIQVSYISA